MVGRKTFKVSQARGLDCLSRCISAIPPLLPPSAPDLLLNPSLAFVQTVRVAHSTMSLVLKSVKERKNKWVKNRHTGSKQDCHV